ncbi:hypothetical protein EDB95_1959 [Dinghuibacter silviterrae]|uniref:Collagen triple helix repeat protein n=2 Tax=Dinghuibacter silviterrae TaxID=1539049 RepID=A0A4R8DSB6_9BACT|nr:hypothetical protein EDB95_1959 [Dinghuibacter silviterrae]
MVLPACTKTGATGPKGATGNANIQYSAWDSTFSGTYATWSVPALTPGVLDSSIVLVFVRQNGYVYQLPYDNVNGSGFYINDLLNTGIITLSCNSGYNLNQFAFRYMIAPGNTVITGLPMDYQSLTSRFGIAP